MVRLDRKNPNKSFAWNQKFTEKNNDRVVVQSGKNWEDYNRNGWTNIKTVIIYVDNNKDNECDIEAHFAIIGAGEDWYSRYSMPFKVKMDHDYDYRYDYLYEQFNPFTGEAQSIISIDTSVPVLNFPHWKSSNRGMGGLQKLDWIFFFAIPIVAAILLFKTDKRPAK